MSLEDGEQLVLNAATLTAYTFELELLERDGHEFGFGLSLLACSLGLVAP